MKMNIADQRQCWWVLKMSKKLINNNMQRVWRSSDVNNINFTQNVILSFLLRGTSSSDVTEQRQVTWRRRETDTWHYHVITVSRDHITCPSIIPWCSSADNNKDARHVTPPQYLLHGSSLLPESLMALRTLLLTTFSYDLDLWPPNLTQRRLSVGGDISTKFDDSESVTGHFCQSIMHAHRYHLWPW